MQREEGRVEEGGYLEGLRHWWALLGVSWWGHLWDSQGQMRRVFRVVFLLLRGRGAHPSDPG